MEIPHYMLKNAKTSVIVCTYKYNYVNLRPIMNCKLLHIATLLLILPLAILAQESQTAYDFLRVPQSAHAAALGGDNISLVEDDPALVYNNPALLSSVSDKTLGINFMTYMQGAVIGGASYSRVVNDKASWGIMAQYVNYGKMKQTTADNTIIGEFSANDMALEGVLSYQLAKNLVGGITAKCIGSFIGDYNSYAVGVDLGLNYYDPDQELSISAVAKNLGGQLKAYDDVYDKMPMDLQIGMTKKFPNMPFRLNATLVDMTHWDYSLLNHCVFGLDLLLGEQFYVSGGYNCRRAYDMKFNTTEEEKASSHGAGLSLGAGLLLDRFKLNVGWAKYHVSSNSLVFNLAFTL